MMNKLTIVYRLCDGMDMLHTTAQEGIHSGNKRSARYYDVPKAQLIRKCLSSVKDNVEAIMSSNARSPESAIAVEFVCVFDQCSDDTLSYVKSLFPDALMLPTKGQGNGASFATCVEFASSMIDDDTMVLFLEDDYTFLMSEGLLRSVMMLDSLKTVNGSGKCALFLDDYPDRYDGGVRHGTDVVVTPYGHLMKIDSSTCSFMTYVGNIKANREHLMRFREYPAVMEGDSVNKMWNEGGVALYCPIPAITLHCQLRTHIPVYMNAENIKRMVEG